MRKAARAAREHRRLSRVYNRSAMLTAQRKNHTSPGVLGKETERRQPSVFFVLQHKKIKMNLWQFRVWEDLQQVHFESPPQEPPEDEKVIVQMRSICSIKLFSLSNAEGLKFVSVCSILIAGTQQERGRSDELCE